MPYQIDWLIENEVMLYIFWGEITSDDLRSALIEASEIRKKIANDHIHSISDTRAVTYNLKIQDTMKVVRELGDIAKTSGWSVTVGKLDFVAKMGIATSRTFLKNKVMSFDTMDEALSRLKQEENNLSWDKLNTEVLEIASSKKNSSNL